MHDDDLEEALAWCRLLRSGAGGAVLRHLVDHHGGARAVLAAGPKAWEAGGLKATTRERLAARDPAPEPADLAWLGSPGHRVLGWNHPDYPALLRETASPPAALFTSGRVELLWHPQLAIVGSRSATPSGRENAASFARALGRHGLVTTSGLAAGIDAAAHVAALDTGAGTVAVVATGPDQCYPRCNRDLARRIEDEGVLVSEHPPGTPARPQQFPSRNRIVAGLSLGTLVVEAAERSGALISARLAADAGREVFALPGSIRNPMARGCHRLIRQGAALVERPTEILDALAPVAARLAQALRRRLDAPIQGQGEALDGPRQGPIDPAQRQVWEALGDDPVDLDHLSIRTGLTVPELSSMLLLMELQGSVSAEHGRYARRH